MNITSTTEPPGDRERHKRDLEDGFCLHRLASPTKRWQKSISGKNQFRTDEILSVPPSLGGAHFDASAAVQEFFRP